MLMTIRSMYAPVSGTLRRLEARRMRAWRSMAGSMSTTSIFCQRSVFSYMVLGTSTKDGRWLSWSMSLGRTTRASIWMPARFDRTNSDALRSSVMGMGGTA